MAEGSGVAELVRANLAVLEEKTYHIPRSMGIGSFDENVDGIRATDTGMIWHYDFMEIIDRKTGLAIAAKVMPKVYLIKAGSRTWWAHFVSTKSNYSDASRKGIRIGSSSSEVREKYGDMPRIINTRNGKYYIYDYSKIIFRIDARETVDKWFIYAIGKTKPGQR